jgi:hypothetical protein
VTSSQAPSRGNNRKSLAVIIIIFVATMMMMMAALLTRWGFLNQVYGVPVFGPGGGRPRGLLEAADRRLRGLLQPVLLQALAYGHLADDPCLVECSLQCAIILVLAAGMI